MKASCPDQQTLNEIFPAEKTEEFFNALYGDAEDGAYDIRLICRMVTEKKAVFAFELACRPGKCLRCNLTYGLPAVFHKHPVISLADIVKKLAHALDWGESYDWVLEPTEEASPECHIIPLILTRHI